ncbi:MAG: NINE protein [Actinobacteria bacterium]|nr:NINE protein [Actinomycetota bacterium]
MVRDDASGATYFLKQIPGVFSDKDYMTALLLSIFLGGLGIDRFYLGYTGLGIAKLLTLGGCGIWHLIDLILIAIRNIPDSNNRPLA